MWLWRFRLRQFNFCNMIALILKTVSFDVSKLLLLRVLQLVIDEGSLRAIFLWRIERWLNAGILLLARWRCFLELFTGAVVTSLTVGFQICHAVQIDQSL